MHIYKTFKVYLLILGFILLAALFGFTRAVTAFSTYIFLNILLILLLLIAFDRYSQRTIAIICYCCLMPIQFSYIIFMIGGREISLSEILFATISSYVFLISSFSLENFLEIKNYNYNFFHNISPSNSISFHDLQYFSTALDKKRKLLNNSSELLTIENISTVLEEVKRNNSFVYINNGTLTPEYFEKVEQSLDDNSIYMVLSDTGSVPSRIISLFTEKPYNHISIAFDRNLHTLISYNGGERVNPPGLNSEMLSYLAKKEDATVYVYSLNVTPEQKLKMIDKIKEINLNGSAYNLLGLVVKKSFKPNIMYCSQFVYTLLEFANANYFTKNKNSIKPTDLIELDYHKKLKFEYEIKF